MRILAVCGLLGAILFACVPSADAGGCYTYHGGGYSYYTPTYTPYVAPTYYPPTYERKVVVLEYLPLFPVGYAAPQKDPPKVEATACEIKQAAMEAKLAVLEAKLTASVAGVAPKVFEPPPSVTVPTPPTPPRATAPAPVPTASPVKSVMVARCASCHDTTIAETKGGKHVLTLNGQRVPLSDALMGAVIRSVSKATMPKGQKLSEDEYNSLMNELIESVSK